MKISYPLKVRESPKNTCSHILQKQTKYLPDSLIYLYVEGSAESDKYFVCFLEVKRIREIFWALNFVIDFASI